MDIYSDRILYEYKRHSYAREDAGITIIQPNRFTWTVAHMASLAARVSEVKEPGEPLPIDTEEVFLWVSIQLVDELGQRRLCRVGYSYYANSLIVSFMTD